jgi:autoinducer 2-degrading protein
MLLKNLVRTGTLLAGARAFAPLAVQRRAFTKMSAAPIGVMVTVEIEESRVPAFLEALKVDAAGSREEEGCLRFDLLKDSEQANTWHFYEIYKNDEAMAVHKTLPHYKAWADFKAGFRRPFDCLLVFVARLRAAASRTESLRSGLPRRPPSPQPDINETIQTQAGGGVVSQKVAKFTADDFTA